MFCVESSLNRLHLSAVSNSNASIMMPVMNPINDDGEEDAELRNLDRELKKLRIDIAMEEDRIKKIYSYIKDISKNVQHINIEMTENVIDLCDSLLDNDVSRPSIGAAAASAASTSTGRNSPSMLPRPLLSRTSTATSLSSSSLAAGKHVKGILKNR
jgi:septal ring factor EnvC (AmiA/AmiB activator)